MIKLIFLLFLILAVGYWLYCLVTYDWDNFEEDEEQAKKDLF